MNEGFGTALAEFMTTNHLTQQEVAERTGIAQPVIGRLLKTAQPEMPTIRKIAEGLNVDIRIEAGGAVVIEPLEEPSDLEFQTSTSELEPGTVYFSVFDRHHQRGVFEATLRYRDGEDEPYDVTYKRQEWVPGYVSNHGFLRWAKSRAKQLLEG